MHKNSKDRTSRSDQSGEARLQTPEQLIARAIIADAQLVDAFERKFGEEATILHICDFVVAFLERVRPDFSVAEAEYLGLAKRFRTGRATLAELEEGIKGVTAFLKEHSVLRKRHDKDYGTLNVIMEILISLVPRKNAHDLVEITFYFVDSIDPQYEYRDIVIDLLRKSFAL